MIRYFTSAVSTLILLAAAAHAAIRWAPSGMPLHRSDYSNIQFKLNQSAAQRLSSDGDPATAVQAALNAWNALPNTSLHFAKLETTTAGIATDGQNLIAFAESSAALAEVGSLVAVTHLVYTTDGNIQESDIILNPAYQFSMTLKSGTYDLQTVITHELGHALGANHATAASATMFWNLALQNNSQAHLQPDDAAFAAEAYPVSGAASPYGILSGKALKDGSPLTGAAVLAVDPRAGITIGGLSSTSDGSFSLRVPPGNYVLLAGPIAPLIPPAAMYGVPASLIDSSFEAAMSPADGTTLRVDAGSVVTASISVAGGASALAVEADGFVTASGAVYTGTPVIQAGQSVDVILLGAGLDSSLVDANVQLIGAGLAVRSGTVRVDSSIRFSDGRNPLRFKVDASLTSQGSASVLITKGTDTALLAGGILVTPVKPSFTAASIVDAASSKGAGVAPGEWVSIYGTAVGPTEPAVATALDPATGGFPAALGGVSVTFDGQPAPLLITSSGQVNVQVPCEVAARTSTTVVVVRNGTASDPVTVPVLAAQPGIFVQAGTSQAIAMNIEDGNVNGQAHPASKGSYITLYATGAGVVDPPVPTGKPAPASPLSFARSVSVTIGGRNADVYQGGVLTPGNVGLLQVSAQIPNDAPSGDVPVTVSVAGQTSPPATIAVK
jgi:uncharacterized protein (TIGR03437 family)